MKLFFRNHASKNKVEARHRWLTPVILAIWEAEIRRIVLQVSKGKKKTPSPGKEV
jgi:hypothetical protein